MPDRRSLLSRPALLALTLLASVAGVTAPAARAVAQPITQPAGETRPPARFSRALLHEGAFLADQPGRLVTIGGGESAFVFDRTDAGRAVPPMSLLRSTTLMRMEQIRDARAGEARFRVSGQVFLYKGRNYLLPTFYRAMSEFTDPAPAAIDPDAPDPSADADPEVDELVRAIEQFSPTPRDGDFDPIAEADLAAHAGDLMPDGSMLTPRRGVFIRTTGGELAFTIDTDADTAVGPTTPIVVLPGRTLALIERLVEEHGLGTPFVLSGRVFQYRGRNYIIPSLVQAKPGDPAGLRSIR